MLQTLSHNLLGRLLGNDYISVEQDSLIAAKKGGEIASYPLRDCKVFAKFEKSFWGEVLTLSIGNDSIKIRFLKRKGVEIFEDVLNAKIAEYVSASLSRTISEFDADVTHRYPRDSCLGRISLLCQGLSEQYKNQSDLWEKHLTPEYLQRVKEIIEFHPVQPNELREYHEAIQLDKRAIFLDQVESHPLTHEQRLGVLRTNDINLVLAAAGTGKTSVMVAKALDLIDRGLASPNEILVLAYNRSAAEELTERLNDKARKGNIHLTTLPQISTFHALGRQLLRDSGVPTHISVFAEDEIKLKQWVTTWLESYLISDGTRLQDFIGLFPQAVNPFDFNTQAEYERYVRDNEFRTLNGERVKGYQELLIANFMFLNGIPYAYEAPYVSKRRIEIGYDYKPDFHIKDTGIYIEHFGIDRQGNTRAGIDSAKYNDIMHRKRALHVECETTLIETFHYEWLEETLIPNLKVKLAELGILCHPVCAEDVLNKLKAEGRVATWSDLMRKALQAIRVERLNKDAILERFKNSGIAQPRKVADLLDALHQGYMQELKNQNAIDFDDMIIRAIQVVNDGDYVPRWSYILVDEFQDISAARMEFIKAIIDKGPKPSLTVVGDDWQSIYRFSGGKLELTTRFDKQFGSFSSTTLQKTFRYNDSIADTAGKFIMENPEQYKKHIETHTKAAESQIYLLDDILGNKNGVYERVVQVVRKIRESDKLASIAVIARYNYLLNDARAELSSQKLSDHINFWSFHKSKGLEVDYGILIGFFQGRSGFPNENKDEAIIEALLPALDSYPHSEERRLLYVGITRARKKIYIIADPTAPSDFVTELLAPKYDINIASTTFQEQFKKTFKCPNCVDGYLRLAKGGFGEFYVCSTGLGCKIGRARVCTKCGAPSVDTGAASICNNIGCRNTMKICERCGRPMKLRDGKFGQFWGCTGYGIKDDQCKHTTKH